MKKKVGIIFGGRSGEHEISIRSALTVIEKIDKEKYDVVPIAITQEGNWLNPTDSLQVLPEATRSLIEMSQAENFENSVALIGDTKYQGLTKLGTDAGSDLSLDVVFPVLQYG